MPAGFEKGDLIDDAYEVIERIGEGGFGDVYRVRQLSMSRDVALKILLQEDEEGDDRLAGRFRREVLAVRNLSHPNTVRIFDFSETENGYLYYTMEYLEGDTLTEHIEKQEGGVSPEEARDILVQVLKSLSEAHSRGIVHRDLKPANVMLADVHGETNFVKVLDFGIAKAANTGSSDLPQQNLTSAENIVGTLRYMAPEQAKEDPLGPYTDLYTLGLVGLELLTGEKVFAGLSNVRILKEQLKPEPIDIPQPFAETELGEILAKALAKDVDRRYDSAKEMREDLEALSSEELQAARLEELPVASAPYGESTTGTGSVAETSPSHSGRQPRDSAESLQQTDAAGQGTGSEELRPATGESEGAADSGSGIPSPSELQADADDKTAQLESSGVDSKEIAGVQADTGSEAPPEVPPEVPSDEGGSAEQVMELEADEVEVAEETGSEPIEGGAAIVDEVEGSSPDSAEEILVGGDDFEQEESTGFDDGEFEVDPEPAVVLGLSWSQLAAAGGAVALLGVGVLVVVPWLGSDSDASEAESRVAIGDGADTGAVAAVPDTGSAESPEAGGPGEMVRVVAGGAEAEVYRDGEKLGTTPLDVDATEGRELELRSNGESKEIVVEEGASSPLKVALGGGDPGEEGEADTGVEADAQMVAQEGSESEGAGADEEEETSGGAETTGSGGSRPGTRGSTPSYGSTGNQGPTGSQGGSTGSPASDEPEEDESDQESGSEEESNEVPVFE